MNKLVRVVFLSGLSAFLQFIPTLAADEKQAETKPVDAGGVRLPWHTTDVRWRGSRTIDDVETIGVTFTVDRDVPDTVNLYISPMGGQYLNKIVFYGGIQSNVNGWPSPTEERRVHPGPGAIFSRWGGEPVSIDAARPEKGGLCESAGYEGEFVSVRQPYRWKAGTYTWEIRKESTEEIEGEPHTWFACYLIEHGGEQEIRVGALRFEGETFSFNGHSTSFVEIYATAKIPRSEVPEVSVVFQPPVVNGEPLLPSAVSIYHPRQGDKGSPSPPLGRAEAVDGGVKVNLYNEVLQGEDVPPNRYSLEVPLRSKQD